MFGRIPHRRDVARAATTVLIAAAALPLAAGNSSPAHAVSTTLVISEYRLYGPNGPNDEFIEIANISTNDITVASVTGTGLAVVASSNGVARCVIPNGTVIPRYGHYLCVNTIGYSLGATATGDATYTTDIPPNSGLALFNTSNAADFTLANRIDAVGHVGVDPLYSEGTAVPTLATAPAGLLTIDYSFYRNLSTPTVPLPGLQTATPGLAEDTDDNATDFVFVDTNGTSAGAGQRLGAPGPENLSSPVVNGGLAVDLLDPCVDSDSAPNLVRDTTSDAANNSTFGTLDFRRTITNNTGGVVARLRARLADLRTFPAPSGTADLRARTSVAVIDTVDRAPCGSGTSNVTVAGTTLEQPPSQPNGGAFNSSLSVGTITLGTPLAPGASVDVRFLFGVQQTGLNSANIVIEALTDGAVTAPAITCLTATNGALVAQCVPPIVAGEEYSTPEDTPLVVAAASGVLDNDFDADSGTLTATLVTAPTNGSIVLNIDGSFTYTPNPNYNGPDSFVYEVSDGSFTVQGTTDIDVTPVDDAPVAVGDAFATPQDTALNVPAAGVLGNDSDIEGDPFTAALVTGPVSGTVVLNADGSFIYTPNAGFVGADSFTYAATESAQGPSSQATVSITVNAVLPTTTTTTATTPPVTPPTTLPTTTAVVPGLPATGGQAGRSAGWAALLLVVGLGLSATAALSRRRARH